MDKQPFFAPEKLITATFTIRCYMPGDGALLADAVNTSYDHLKTFMVWAKPHTEVVETERSVRRWRAQYLLNENFTLGIFTPSGKRLLGSSGFHLREGDLENGAAEVGMWLRADAVGQGLGTRVLRGLLDWGFSAWPWERITWHCAARNIASRRTAEKAGMHYEGCMRAVHRLADGTREDSLCFSALRGE